MPMSRLCTGRSVMSRPATWMRPESGNSKPAIMRNDVVLPQPEGPSREKNSPAAMSSVTPSTATTRPSKVLVTFSRRMVAEVIHRQCHPEAEGRGTFPDPQRSLAMLGMTVLPFQQFRHPRVDVLLAGVVPFPVGLDQRGDLGLDGEQFRVVLAVELHLLVRRRVPHAFSQQLLHVWPQHVVDIGEGQLLHLGARRHVKHLLERQHAFRRTGKIDRLVLAVIAV